MFSIKEASHAAGITPQAIYKDKDKLIASGYMLKSTDGDWEITPEGINHLRERKAKKIRQVVKPTIQQVDNQPQTTTPTKEPEQLDFNTLNLLYNQVKQQLSTTEKLLEKEQEEKEFFRAKFEEKDKLLNQYINTHLLPPGNKTSFFSKIFSKKED